jgi:alpha-L-rhamnosidase
MQFNFKSLVTFKEMLKYICCIFILFNLDIKDLHAQSLKISLATCESKINPLGVPLTDIHFSWQLESKKRNTTQKTYQLVIATTVENLQKEKMDVYNSGIVQTDQNMLVSYNKKELKPGKTYYWKVKAWDDHNQTSGWSDTQHFTTGLFDNKDWSGAKWIGYEELPDSLLVKPGVPDTSGLGNKCIRRSIIPYFRKQFTIDKKPLRALAFITGLGQYEMSINGKKTGNNFLSPGWTYYDKRCLYNIYDITNTINRGSNAIGVMVGNGFYNINRERYYKLVDAFGAPKMICKISIVYDDGSTETIISDEQWKASPSPVIYSSIYGGEDYDATHDQNGWDIPGFDDAHWENALIVKSPLLKLEPETDYPVQVMESIAAKKIKKINDHVFLYDFGQNASGIVQLNVTGHKGDTIKLTPAELIDSNNFPNQNASGKPYYYTYILKCEGNETWQPKFSYYGFRYMLVEGGTPDSTRDTKLPSISKLTLLHTRNSAPASGAFSCSDTLFNKINTLIQWAIKSNMQSLITDCPHREKLGWMEQNYLMGTSIQYNFNIHLLYKKLIKDMMDAQTPEGLVPDIAPEFVVFDQGFRDSPEWGSAAVILPWLLYKWYGDKQSMQEAYDMMKRYVDYLDSKSKNHILSYGLGDWYDYGPGFPGYAQLTPVALTATAIFYYDVTLLSKMAELMHDKNELQKLNALAAQIENAFNQKFFNQQTKIYSTGSQTAMAMSYCVGLVEEKDKPFVLKNLVDSINQTGFRLTAGDIGFHFLIKALDDGGASQMIYEMNHRDDVPGYGFQLKKGATALTESWAALPEVSNNHLMLGHIMEWFYSGLAGIGQTENSIAYKHIKIRPQLVGDIVSAKASFQSPNGLILSEWKKGNNHFLLHVIIPVNSKATIYLPVTAISKIKESDKPFSRALIKISNNSAIIDIGSGEYWFKLY